MAALAPEGRFLCKDEYQDERVFGVLLFLLVDSFGV